MNIAGSWFKRSLMVAAIVTSIFFMANFGVANATNLWTEKQIVTKETPFPAGVTLFRGLAEKLSPAVVNVRPMKKVTNAYGNMPYGFPHRNPSQMKPRGSAEFRQRVPGRGHTRVCRQRFHHPQGRGLCDLRRDRRQDRPGRIALLECG